MLPVYWKLLAEVPLAEVLAHRVAGTVVFCAVLLAVVRRMPEVSEALRSPRERRALLASGTLIAVNWGVFIWAVGAGRIVETSLGYYLNPIVNVLLGVAILREQLSRAQGIAAVLAAAGVGVMLVSHGELPWIALVLATSFGLYGLMHKLTHVRAIPALAIETGALAPLALGFLALGTEPPGGALRDGPRPRAHAAARRRPDHRAPAPLVRQRRAAAPALDARALPVPGADPRAAARGLLVRRAVHPRARARVPADLERARALHGRRVSGVAQIGREIEHHPLSADQLAGAGPRGRFVGALHDHDPRTRASGEAEAHLVDGAAGRARRLRAPPRSRRARRGSRTTRRVRTGCARRSRPW